MREEAKSPDGTGSRMGSRVSIGKWKGHPTYQWWAEFIEGGKRRKRGFKTKTAAEKWKAQKEAETLLHGTSDTISASERAAFVETRGTLGEFGITLREALDHAIEYHRRARKSASVDTLVSEIIDSRQKANRSSRYLEDLRSRLGLFQKDFGSVRFRRLLTGKLPIGCRN